MNINTGERIFTAANCFTLYHIYDVLMFSLILLRGKSGWSWYPTEWRWRCLTNRSSKHRFLTTVWNSHMAINMQRLFTSEQLQSSFKSITVASFSQSRLKESKGCVHPQQRLRYTEHSLSMSHSEHMLCRITPWSPQQDSVLESNQVGLVAQPALFSYCQQIPRKC